MSNDHELDPFTAEQLLHGEPVDPAESPDGAALSGLLAAAAAPATADELSDEDAAVAAFAAQVADQPRRLQRTFVAKAFTIKVAAALTLAVGAGAAAAAATDRLPGIQRSERPTATQSAFPSPTVKPSAMIPTTSTPAAPPVRRTPEAPPSTKPRATSNPTAPRATSTPPSQLFGLCVAYAAASKHNGKAPDHPGFAPLIKAAGGQAKVLVYCDALVKKTLKDRSRDSPDRPDQDDPSDTGRRDRDDDTTKKDHPTGRPTPHPTRRPTAPTTGHPTDGSAPPPRNR